MEKLSVSYNDIFVKWHFKQKQKVLLSGVWLYKIKLGKQKHFLRCNVESVSHNSFLDFANFFSFKVLEVFVLSGRQLSPLELLKLWAELGEKNQFQKLLFIIHIKG